ncbi:peptide/nickel transport system permease protein/glutathione transport system permease protein [Humitalea rosea]|uniref:Peptide/nickel transport system permease protein/glutathione transport system permease protein n=1 Tax=Humitalea rosea TaxID=990373 RepID=A0A2W7IVY5_9PROT|nr:ABC transporter permease [Humitalea rosea]PZW43647.1 peptide/nickel transport system permease protein/glutathione transport system permease protein [Humitalea rosea]
MLGFVLRRLLAAIPTLLAVLTLVFVIVRVVPGDPALVILGDQATPEATAAVRERLGLDRPLLVQYFDFLGSALQGDFGNSLVTNRPILSEVRAVLPHTVDLTLASMVIGVAIGVPVGIWAALNRNGVIDVMARLLSLIGLSFPVFVSGVFLLLAFGLHWRLFPVIGSADLNDPLDRLHKLVLPAMTLGLLMAAYITRVTRSAMLQSLGEDYMRTARAKGVPRRRVVWVHGLRNAALPIVTVVGLYVGILLGNSVLTEIVFNRPGLGKIIVGALNQRDYPMLQGLLVIYCFLIVIVNLITDLLYGVIDPRVKAA